MVSLIFFMTPKSTIVCVCVCVFIYAHGYAIAQERFSKNIIFSIKLCWNLYRNLSDYK